MSAHVCTTDMSWGKTPTNLWGWRGCTHMHMIVQNGNLNSLSSQTANTAKFASNHASVHRHRHHVAPSTSTTSQQSLQTRARRQMPQLKARPQARCSQSAKRRFLPCLRFFCQNALCIKTESSATLALQQQANPQSPRTQSSIKKPSNVQHSNAQDRILNVFSADDANVLRNQPCFNA